MIIYKYIKNKRLLYPKAQEAANDRGSTLIYRLIFHFSLPDALSRFSPARAPSR